MKYLNFILLFILPVCLTSQAIQDSTTVNSRYLEDPFYLGITYNFLLDQPQPDLVSQRNFSYGLQAGFIKDIPINSDRTLGLGIGIGVALNTYYTNIVASESNNGVGYTIDTASEYKRSKLETHLVELPFEFRWRNSTAEEYKFWRIYTGIKFGYAFDARSKSVSENRKDSFSNTDVRQFQYGITFNFGYSSFNAHFYYALSSLFNDDVLLNGAAIKMKPLRVGLIFYIL